MILSVILLLLISSLSEAKLVISEIQVSWINNSTMLMRLRDNTTNEIILTPASNIPGEETPCLFSGKVARDSNSVVAVSGCKSSLKTSLTIASSLVPGGLLDLSIIDKVTYQFIVDLNESGTDELQPKGRKRRQALVISDQDTVIPPPILNEVFGQFSGPLPSKVKLQTDVMFDVSLKEHFGNSDSGAKDWISRVVELTKPRMAHPSLDMPIELQVGKVEFLSDKRIEASSNDIYDLAKNLKPKSLTSFFCKDLGGGVIGIAFLRAACRTDGYAVNINELYTLANSELATARTFAHELGHNIGMRHDFDATHGGQSSECNGQGLMSYGRSRPDKWSKCSNSDFNSWWRSIGYKCMGETTRGSGITLHATCDNWMKIFFDGKLAFEDTHYGKILSSRPWQWEVQTAIEIPENTKTIGIECQNFGPGYRGIIASASNGVVSNTLSWMCTPKQSVDWAKPGSLAPFYYPQSFGENGVGPWGKRKDISSEANWIWAPNTQSNSVWAGCMHSLNSGIENGQCVRDSGWRLLPHFKDLGNSNSPGNCYKYCASQKYQYFGVQNAKQCFCGNTAPSTARYRPATECNKKCPGQKSRKCGGIWRMNVYKSGDRSLYATCDNYMRIYFDGELVFEDAFFGIDMRPYQWSLTTVLKIPDAVENIGISCLNHGGPKGILASVTNGIETSTSSWECTTEKSEGWAKPDSEAQFLQPKSFGTNGASPWGNRPGISTTATWIWAQGDSEWAGCRQKI